MGRWVNISQYLQWENWFPRRSLLIVLPQWFCKIPRYNSADYFLPAVCLFLHSSIRILSKTNINIYLLSLRTLPRRSSKMWFGSSADWQSNLPVALSKNITNSQKMPYVCSPLPTLLQFFLFLSPLFIVYIFRPPVCKQGISLLNSSSFPRSLIKYAYSYSLLFRCVCFVPCRNDS